ncbi:MAG: peptidase propeptide domain-containing protein [Methanobacterium sp.]|nr:peptidase propeptide domain-containing protein [Methanobacterium sp.]
MIDKKILISIVIVLLIGVTAASYQITSKTPGLWQTSISQHPIATDQGSDALSEAQPGSSSTGSGQSGSGVNVKVSPTEAQTIAQDHNLQTNTITGTPKLVTVDGKQLYYVPIFDKNNNQIGEIYVDAQTGKTSLE